MDAIEALAFKAKRCAAVLGRTDTSEFLLVPVGGAVTEALKAQIHERQFRFIGVFGSIDGNFAVAIEPGDNEAAALMIKAVPAYLNLMWEQAAAREGDSRKWLEALYSLEDRRDEKV